MTTAADRPPLPRRRPGNPTVRRADVMAEMERYTNTPGIWAVELVLVAGDVARMVVHYESGDKTELTVTEDA